ncbi:toll/interleukin-1 receptor domain-containing protein [Halomonas denitrificans]|nr:toll/interleukin-1 receptor domain-containing protein [Halomonas denitrificans]
MGMRYRAFISYSWADKAWAGWLHRALETYRPPDALVGRSTPVGPVPSRLHPIFKDREEEAAGHGISASIEAAMADAEFMVVVCSPRSVRSKWVNREIAWFKTHRSKERILALVVDGEPGASLAEGCRPNESDRECFPETLLYEVDDDLNSTAVREDMPLAADARRGGDGKRLARLKLAAALLGLGLDELVRRDERRRAARFRWIAIGSGSIAVAMAALALVAVQQRDRALAMQAAAEVQRNQAEGLVEFMIGDLRHKLEEDVQIDVLADIATRAQDYYAVQLDLRMDDDALGRRARVLDLLGDLKMDFGQSEQAVELLRQSVEASAELLRRDPDNPDRILEQAHSVQGLGALYFQRGAPHEAEALMERAVELTGRLVQLDPGEPEWRGEQGSALVNLGVMRLNRNALAEAAGSFREAVDIKRSSVATAHNVRAARYDLSLTYAWLARALLRQGELDAAHDAWRDEDAVIGELLADNASDGPVLRRRAVNRINRAEAYLHAGKIDRALEFARVAVEGAEAALTDDASDLRGMESAARAHWVLGNARLERGEVEAARESADRSAELTERLTAIDAERFSWTGALLGASRVLTARVGAAAASSVNDCRDALEPIAVEAERLATLAAAHPSDADLASIAGAALVLYGDREALAGESSRARTQWTRAEATVRRGAAYGLLQEPASRRVVEDLDRRARSDAQAVDRVVAEVCRRDPRGAGLESDN